MDAATEPLLVVIDHPIAGNPAQFAIESALRAGKLDWRVLSFDVKPDDVATALDGFAVTGIAGVLIGRPLQPAATRWYGERFHTNEPRIDCLARNQQRKFVGVDQQTEWVNDYLRSHLGDRDDAVTGIWFGDSIEDLPIVGGLLSDQPTPVPPPPGTIEKADWIALTQGETGPAPLEEDEWPPDNGSTLVVDLSASDVGEGHPRLSSIAALGYTIVTRLDCRVGTIRRALRLWTGVDPSPEVIHDAIEEYLGV